MADQKRRTPTSGVMREFLRGYLHQDWKQDHGSVEEATRHFCEDADPEQCRNLLTEWQSFRVSVRDQSLDAIARKLRELGSAWQPATLEDLDKITCVLQQHPAD